MKTIQMSTLMVALFQSWVTGVCVSFWVNAFGTYSDTVPLTAAWKVLKHCIE